MLKILYDYSIDIEVIEPPCGGTDVIIFGLDGYSGESLAITVN